MKNWGWFEEYKCGCCSSAVKTKKELLGYCEKHGSDRIRIYPQIKRPPITTYKLYGKHTQITTN